jgi:hypothetical protein
LAGNFSATFVQVGVNLFRPAAKDAQYAANGLESVAGHEALLATFEELGQGILQEGQGAWLVGYVGHDGRGQPPF